MARMDRRTNTMRPVRLTLLALLLALSVAACAGEPAPATPASVAPASMTPPAVTAAQALAKIGFPLTDFDADGLVGPADGKRAQDYEFCIPAQDACAAAVQQLDPSVKLMKGSRGRVGCGPGTWLCIGNTHQQNWRAILLQLAALPYVARINRCDWE